MLRRAVLAVLVALTATSWLTPAWLSTLPRSDGAGRMVLYYAWHHTSQWWAGLALAAAALLSLVLAAVVILAVVRRLRGPWQVITEVVGAGAWLCGAAYLAVLVWMTALGVGGQGTQTVVRGADATTVMVTQDGFDGDTVGIWLPASSVTFVRVPGEGTVDPRSGPCRLDRGTQSQVVLTCGATSQRLGIDARRP
jgi:hypothetical protein